jgi:hypothetical protein
MRTILDKIPYSILIVAAILMLLAPFKPMPHVLEILQLCLIQFRQEKLA